MPKKLAPEIIKFRETLEALRKQHEEGFQDKRIDAALNALKGIKSDIAQLSKYVDDVIKTFETEEANGNDQLPPIDPKDEVPPPPFNENAPDIIGDPQEELFPAEVKA